MSPTKTPIERYLDHSVYLSLQHALRLTDNPTVIADWLREMADKLEEEA